MTPADSFLFVPNCLWGHLTGNGGLCPRVKQPGHDADHTPPSSVKIKK